MTSCVRLLRAVVAAVLMTGLTTGALAGCVVVSETEQVPPGGSPQPGDGQGGADRNGYAFIRTQEDGEPVRWSTCEPIRYVVREANQPDGAQRLLEDSVRRISEATGLEFSFEGTTDEGPADQRPLYQPERYGDAWAPVLVAYSDAEEYGRLRDRRAGYGGPASVRLGDRTPRFVSGMAVIDVEQVDRMGGDEAFRAVMLHELAHVMGLAHVDDRDQLMNAVQYGREVTTLQAGDLRGLEMLGDGECHDPIEPRALRQ